jgi:predicted transcriptional regulator
MIDQNLLESIFDEKIIGVIRSLLNQNTEFFSIREIAEKSDVTISTTFRIVQSLESVGFVKKIKRGRIKFFQIQKSSKAYKQLSELFNRKIDIEQQIKSRINDLYSNIEVDIHIPKKDKNKLFIVTDAELDDFKLNNEVSDIIEKKVKLMSIEPQQFEKMKKIGLI